MTTAAQTPVARTCPVISDRAIQCSWLAAFYLIAALWGYRSSQLASATVLDALMPLALNVIIGWWAIGDSVLRGRPICLLSRCWTVMLAKLVVPGYLVASRGWLGAGLIALHTLLWLAVLAISFTLAQTLFLIWSQGR